MTYQDRHQREAARVAGIVARDRARHAPNAALPVAPAERAPADAERLAYEQAVLAHDDQEAWLVGNGCSGCGAAFVDPTAVGYCSAECRDEAEREAPTPCAGPGCDVPTAMEYCSQACADAAWA